jgi:hypothetical protein
MDTIGLHVVRSIGKLFVDALAAKADVDFEYTRGIEQLPDGSITSS